MHKPQRLKLTDINPHLTCVLCSGYLIDATTIIECLHSFCRRCIIRYLHSSKYCPICEVQVHKTRPLDNLRSDKTLQDLVYKLVPGLFKEEMKRRRDFYARHADADPSSTAIDVREKKGEVYGSRLIFTEEEKISLILQNCDRLPSPRSCKTSKRNGKGHDRRYLLCPAAINIGHLKKFLKCKFDLGAKYEIELFHAYENLSDDCTLMDVAYITGWRRVKPLRLRYIVFEELELKPEEATCKVKHLPSESTPPDKKTTTKKKRGRPPGKQFPLLDVDLPKPIRSEHSVLTSAGSPGVPETERTIPDSQCGSNSQEQVVDKPGMSDKMTARDIESPENNIVAIPSKVEKGVDDAELQDISTMPSEEACRSSVSLTIQKDIILDTACKPTLPDSVPESDITVSTEAESDEKVSCKMDMVNNNNSLESMNNKEPSSHCPLSIESKVHVTAATSMCSNLKTDPLDSNATETQPSADITQPSADTTQPSADIISESVSSKQCSTPNPVEAHSQTELHHDTKMQHKENVATENVTTSVCKSKVNISSRIRPMINVASSSSVVTGVSHMSQMVKHSNLAFTSRPGLQLTMTTSGIKINGTPVTLNNKCQIPINTTPLPSIVLVPTSSSKGQSIQLLKTPVSALLPASVTKSKPPMVKITAGPLPAKSITITNNQNVGALSSAPVSSPLPTGQALKTYIPVTNYSMDMDKDKADPEPTVSNSEMMAQIASNSSTHIKAFSKLPLEPNATQSIVKTDNQSNNLKVNIPVSSVSTGISSHVRNVVSFCITKASNVLSTKVDTPVFSARQMTVSQDGSLKRPSNPLIQCPVSPRKQTMPVKRGPGGPIFPSNKSTKYPKMQNKLFQCKSTALSKCGNEPKSLQESSTKNSNTTKTTQQNNQTPPNKCTHNEGQSDQPDLSSMRAGHMPESHSISKQTSSSHNQSATPKIEESIRLCKSREVSIDGTNSVSVPDEIPTKGDGQESDARSPTLQNVATLSRMVPDYTRYRNDVVTTKLANDRKPGDQPEHQADPVRDQQTDVYSFDDSLPSSPSKSNCDSNKDKVKNVKPPSKSKTNSPNKQNRTSPKRTPQAQKRPSKVNEALEKHVKRLPREQVQASSTYHSANQSSTKQDGDAVNLINGSSSINYIPNTLKIKVNLEQKTGSQVSNGKTQDTNQPTASDIGHRKFNQRETQTNMECNERTCSLERNISLPAMMTHTSELIPDKQTLPAKSLSADHPLEILSGMPKKNMPQMVKNHIQPAQKLYEGPEIIQSKAKVENVQIKDSAVVSCSSQPEVKHCIQCDCNPSHKITNCAKKCLQPSTMNHMVNPDDTPKSCSVGCDDSGLLNLNQTIACNIKKDCSNPELQTFEAPKETKAMGNDSKSNIEKSEEISLEAKSESNVLSVQKEQLLTSESCTPSVSVSVTISPSDSFHAVVSSTQTPSTSTCNNVDITTQGRVENMKSLPRPTSAPPLQKSIPTHKLSYPRPEILSKLIGRVTTPLRANDKLQSGAVPTSKPTPNNGLSDSEQTLELSTSHNVPVTGTEISPDQGLISSEVQQSAQSVPHSDFLPHSQYITAPMLYSTLNSSSVLSVPTTYHAAAADAAVSLLSLGLGCGINHSNQSHSRDPQVSVQGTIASPESTESVVTDLGNGMREYWSGSKGRIDDLYPRKVNTGKTYDDTDMTALRTPRNTSSPNNSTQPHRQHTDRRKHSQSETPPIKKLKLMCNGITFDGKGDSAPPTSGHNCRHRKNPKYPQVTNPSITYSSLGSMSGFAPRTNISSLYDVSVKSSSSAMPNGQSLSYPNVRLQHSVTSPPYKNGLVPLAFASGYSSLTSPSFYEKHFRQPSPNAPVETPSIVSTSPLAPAPLTCRLAGNGYDAPLELTTKTAQDRHKEREKERRSSHGYVETDSLNGLVTRHEKSFNLPIVHGPK